MAAYDIAHINQQGVDLIIIPLDSSFEYKSSSDQNEIIASLQFCAQSAGLAGTVVPVWNYNGRMRFIAPSNWHPFFSGINLQYVQMNINRRLTCG